MLNKSRQMEPRKSQPPQIVFPPWLIIQRIATQWAVGARSGDMKKPCKS